MWTFGHTLYTLNFKLMTITFYSNLRLKRYDFQTSNISRNAKFETNSDERFLIKNKQQFMYRVCANLCLYFLVSPIPLSTLERIR